MKKQIFLANGSIINLVNSKDHEGSREEYNMRKFKAHGKTYSKIVIPTHLNLLIPDNGITIALSHNSLMKWRAYYKDRWEFGKSPEEAVGLLIIKLFGKED